MTDAIASPTTFLGGGTAAVAVIDCATNKYLHPVCDGWAFWTTIATISGMIFVSAILAGMLMGYMSLDKLNIMILTMEGSDVEKAQARRVLPLVDQSHRVLVSLLLINYVGLEALPIWLNRLVPEGTAIAISVTFVLFFGEILPSAVFTGNHQVAIAAHLAPLCRFVMLVTAPVSWPIAKALDHFMGDDNDIVRYRRNELKALIALQQTATTSPTAAASTRGMWGLPSWTHDEIATTWGSSPVSDHTTDLLDDEVTIINSALDMSTKCVRDIMTPFEKVYMLDQERRLDRALMAEILACGYSRIPVFAGHRHNIVGILLVKRLIVADPRAKKPLKDLVLRKPHVIPPTMLCYTMLRQFQLGRGHFALLAENAAYVQACWDAQLPIDPTKASFVGVITNEDVLEELIQETIQDESDTRDLTLGKIVSDSHRTQLREAGMNRALKQFRAMAARARNRLSIRRRRGSSLDNTSGTLSKKTSIESMTTRSATSSERTPLIDK
ncbi:Aste57867_16016 [Aphanomyces stellatus]|uniref:Aste57867_16016 protein n=1 Tax=Aphanomyces stellatus TaxID=120398 RepID=A0A485L5G2_9STRA|nr:hypothetical protein As57867_015960 [Aphanomyces stellatus]VFT92801.1 Aste57867_16016 [Aphanomyces stellatus]